MPGPPPKPDAARRRRNKESKSVHVPAGECWAKNRPVPPLPKRKRDWAPEISEWFTGIFFSEMSALWIGTDVEPLIRLATLKQTVLDAGDQRLYVELLEAGKVDLHGAKKIVIAVTVPVAVLGAIKDLEDRFALNQLARRRAGVEIDAPGGSAVETAGELTARVKQTDRRSRLSIVS